MAKQSNSSRPTPVSLERLLDLHPEPGILRWLLRTGLVWSRQQTGAQAGFVLPTATLVILVSTLVVGTLTFRVFSRANQVITNRDFRIVSNAATPAVDRAKAKLEYLYGALFRKPGLPPEELMTGYVSGANEFGMTRDEIYTLPDETRAPITFDVDGDGNADPMPIWSYTEDTNQDGLLDTRTTYLIAVQQDRQDSVGSTLSVADIEANASLTQAQKDNLKAQNMLVRNAPVLSAGAAGAGCVRTGGIAFGQGGWFPVSGKLSNRVKSFQVVAVTVPLQSDGVTADTSKPIKALEYQIDRRLTGIGRFGMWFITDIDLLYPPSFRWNGAIHSEGNVGIYPVTSQADWHVISAPKSCFFSEFENSEITPAAHFVMGALAENDAGAGSPPLVVYNLPTTEVAPIGPQVVTLSSSTQDSLNFTGNLVEITVDPLALQTTNIPRPRNFSTLWPNLLDTNWVSSSLAKDSTAAAANNALGRFEVLTTECPPYVDDFYRADDRYGPKTSYARPQRLEGNDTLPCVSIPWNYNDSSRVLGTRIQSGDSVPTSFLSSTEVETTEGDEIIRTEPDGDDDAVGLDGYWERRARVRGMRIIVGQRLELSGPQMPALHLTHEALQRRTLRNSLAAVQSTAVYHYTQDDGFLPVACIATTVHPGTDVTLRRSATFQLSGSTPVVDFFTGNGTNGWEFEPPPIDSSGPDSSMMIALKNLAQFAGDSEGNGEGAFPPAQQAQSTFGTIFNLDPIRPHPIQTGWGNFSELRRTIELMESGVPYSDLSLADQSNLHTAACTIGMLAYNLENPTGDPNSPTSTDIADVRTNGHRATALRRFPSLLPIYYIFPQTTHTEERYRQPGANYTGNSFSRTEQDSYESLNPSSVDIQPRPIGSWETPVLALGSSPAGAPNSSQFGLIRTVSGGGTTTDYRVAFKDTAIYNGRESMLTRALNLDIDLLRQTPIGSDEVWLPAGSEELSQPGGIVYAFREDAVREDAIARPRLGASAAAAAWSSFFSNWLGTSQGVVNSASLRMNAGRYPLTGVSTFGDPPQFPQGVSLSEASIGLNYLNYNLTWPGNQVSPKAIDYYADPDRRPNGFRFIQGETVRREGIDPERNIWGMTFVTDGPVYVQGDFNR
ncbi:MAG: hypothetical protein IGQ88_02535, partial [Gloeomargaritaceae cyanobacterium C42_A2020_066]|nr:hypothetical protein [Gloeomargaritaceae cyanobacterium C42_A2020_066]